MATGQNDTYKMLFLKTFCSLLHCAVLTGGGGGRG